MKPKFVSPPQPVDFNIQVWQMVQQIPHGKVATYGQIAKLIPIPSGLDEKRYAAFAARWVGGAMAACPENVPWHRVINAKGEISLRPGQGQEIQRQLLESEGVIFNQSGRIDLKTFQWQGPE
jgi:methylated-DNA-protein-cysteine methyltransferase-like protein